MTAAATRTLVFKDSTGDYFLVPRETLEQGRVPEERKAEVEQLIAGAEAARTGDGDDASGYIWPLIIAAEIGIGAAVFIGWTGPEVPSGPSTGGGGKAAIEAFQKGVRQGSGKGPGTPQ